MWLNVTTILVPLYHILITSWMISLRSTSRWSRQISCGKQTQNHERTLRNHPSFKIMHEGSHLGKRDLVSRGAVLTQSWLEISACCAALPHELPPDTLSRNYSQESGLQHLQSVTVSTCKRRTFLSNNWAPKLGVCLYMDIRFPLFQCDPIPESETLRLIQGGIRNFKTSCFSAFQNFFIKSQLASKPFEVITFSMQSIASYSQRSKDLLVPLHLSHAKQNTKKVFFIFSTAQCTLEFFCWSLLQLINNWNSRIALLRA